MLSRWSWAGLGMIVATACAGVGGPNAAGDETTIRPVSPPGSLGVGVREPPWPRVDSTLPPLDPGRIVALTPDSSEALFRTDVAVRFEEGVTDPEIVAFLRRFNARVTALTFTGSFFLRIPDPGPDVEALYAITRSMREDPRVRLAHTIPSSPPVLVFPDRIEP